MNFYDSYFDYTSSYKKIIAEGIEKFGGYKNIVFTNGCFDILHPGHILVLKQARELAGPYGAVIVGINSDDSCRRLKGSTRPIIQQAARKLLLCSLIYVDHVIVFNEDTPLRLIQEILPNFIIKGGDYSIDNVIGNNVSSVIIASYDEKWSTSKIIKKIQEMS